jgi:hypothetical protein
MAADPQTTRTAAGPADVLWTTPSDDARGSMPLGNGDIGINVWVEPTGDLVLFLAKTDAFDEFNRLLKLGRIRVRTTPPLFTAGDEFAQRLRIADGTIEIESALGNVRIWVDAHHPVVQIEFEGTEPIHATVALECWRTEARELLGGSPWTGSIYDEGSSCWGNRPEKQMVLPDTILPRESDRLAWCHRNVESQWASNLELTALDAAAAAQQDPMLDRTFGATVRARGFTAVDDTELRSVAPASTFSIEIVALTTFAKSTADWRVEATRALEALPLSIDDRRWAHIHWWREFWSRSHIEVGPASGSAQSVAAGTHSVTRAYALQRFLNACAGRGALPIKFNGSLFNVDELHDADYRAWGGGYWWQNTRAPYWSMLAAGDVDLMAPLFRMYLDALPLRQAATRTYYGHEGAFYPETMYFWGNYMDAENYGIDRDGLTDGEAFNPYIRRHWQGAIELVAMMLDVYEQTKDPTFRDKVLIPVARQITLFHEQHWGRDDRQRLRMEPAQSLETWQTAVNPLPEIAGLRFILPRLIALATDGALRDHWVRLRAALPPLPVTVDDSGRPRLAPAESYTDRANVESPELYAVYPYRLYTTLADDDDLELALRTWDARIPHEDYGWQETVIMAPLLGLARQAQEMQVARAARTAAGYRFPGFYGPNYDWTPDQCHGGNLMTGLQRMLMQCDGDRIVLMPAWPSEWNAHFRLHAPGNTLVEGRVEDGALIDLVVTPASRLSDVEIRAAQ